MIASRLDHVEGEVGIMRRERSAGLADGLFDERAHPQDGVLDLLLLQIQGVATGMRTRERR